MATHHEDYVEVRLREDGPTVEQVAAALLQFAEDPDHVHSYPTPDVPHGVVFEVHPDVARRYQAAKKGQARGGRKAGAEATE